MGEPEKSKEGKVHRIAKEGVQSSGPREEDPRQPTQAGNKKPKSA